MRNDAYSFMGLRLRCCGISNAHNEGVLIGSQMSMPVAGYGTCVKRPVRLKGFSPSVRGSRIRRSRLLRQTEVRPKYSYRTYARIVQAHAPPKG